MKVAIRCGLMSRSEAISANGYDAKDVDREIGAHSACADHPSQLAGQSGCLDAWCNATIDYSRKPFFRQPPGQMIKASPSVCLLMSLFTNVRPL